MRFPPAQSQSVGFIPSEFSCALYVPAAVPPPISKLTRKRRKEEEGKGVRGKAAEEKRRGKERKRGQEKGKEKGKGKGKRGHTYFISCFSFAGLPIALTLKHTLNFSSIQLINFVLPNAFSCWIISVICTQQISPCA